MSNKRMFSSAMVPDDADTTQYIQHIELMMQQFLDMGHMVLTALEQEAPVLVRQSAQTSNTSLALASQGLMLMATLTSLRAFMERSGIPRLDLATEQQRVAREQLARTDLDPEMREVLLEVLGEGLSEGVKAGDSSPWPFVMPGGREVH